MRSISPHDVSRSLSKDPGRSRSRYSRTYLIYKYLHRELGLMRNQTVKTGIIGPHAKTARIPSFGLGRENTARRFSFSPPLRQIKINNTPNLTRRGNLNVLARISIISVFTVEKKFLERIHSPHDVSRSLGKDSSNARGDPGRSKADIYVHALFVSISISGERAWVNEGSNSKS